MLNTLRKTAALTVACGMALTARAADIEHGKDLATKQYACTSCHGDNFAKPIDANTPILAGQYADYLEHALMTYKHGTNPMMGRNNAIMDSMAAPLSDKDVADIAGYIASLPGPLVQKK